MPSQLKVLCTVALLTVAGAGCASGTSSGIAAPVRKMSVLSAEELQNPEVKDGYLLDAIQRLRPNFLITRGSPDRDGTVPVVEVSVNDGPLAALSTIAQIRVDAVQSVTLFTVAEAGQRFGLRDRFGPVLLVRLK